ncbi:TraG/TraD/VirD4 family protein [Aldersonia sp. NBC_00410]|uniref:type IV secretory system conjugative DNA transfer family protein n=1 Tax=Aldersonia sp. NBC_00410 TaxID=2975954 RepID=UPI0022504E9B|nr:type IV secretory system conjugative DNA transfer family protein [Aldersonia sp. NBC_00410]MCX5042493.1 TraG/TraD/VirD4 family protein [Aldersonia sp. NBC_00410]
MTTQARRKRGGERSEWAPLLLLASVATVASVVWAALSLGEILTGESPNANPIAALLEVAMGKRRWPTTATVILVALVVAAVAGAVMLAWAVRGRVGRRHAVDRAARTMTPTRNLRGAVGHDADQLAGRLLPDSVRTDIEAAASRKRFSDTHGRPPVDHKELLVWTTEQEALAAPGTDRERFTAALGKEPVSGKELARWVEHNPDLGRARHRPSYRGVRLGRTVAGNTMVYQPWELPGAAIAGTRMGKTAGLAIVAVCDAPGPVIANSNKPDLYGHTRLVRELVGRAWICDLQGIAGQPGADFYWDALARVTRLAEARRLASFFVSASTAKGARVDSYFDGGAQELLALYMLAAGCVGGDLLHVVEWLGNDQNPLPVTILTQHNKLRAAGRVKEAHLLHPRQRQGLYDMARRFLDVLSDDEYAALILPPSRLSVSVTGQKAVVQFGPRTHDRPQFDPVAFVTSYDTLYPLSRKGPDSTAPLTTALIGQVLDAAAAVAVRNRDARLRVPLLAVLDEAANTCRLAELPDQYSYLGGHGVILLSILQSRKQGARVWGADEFAEMLDQSVHVYGGNVADTGYLKEWSDLTGVHQVSTESISSGKGGASKSRSWHDEPVLTVDNLGALPKDRALVRFPENRPVLIRKLWWWDTEHADLIRASIARYGGAIDDDEPEAAPATATGTTPTTASEAIEL